MAGTQEKAYVTLLSPEDRKRYRHVKRGKRILAFTVQYETMVEGEWHPAKEITVKSQDMFFKNQQLSTEFDLYLLDHPEVADRIPDGALVVFIPEFDRSLARKNRALAAKLKERGQPVVYVKVKRIATSRLEGLSLEVA